jgi:CheY-like chemotaxis protein
MPQAKRVLIIEDQIDAAQSLAALVSVLGHQSRFVTNPLEAISTAKEFRDIGMPGLNGWEVVKLFRQDPLFRSLKIFALTAYSQPEDLQRSREAGFDLHLTKPISTAQLEELLS